MILVVDGFNLIYKFPDLEILMYENKLNEARKGLLDNLLLFGKKRKQSKFHIFFDGKKEQGSMVVEDEFQGMRIYYSHDIKADDHIKLFIRQSINASDLYLVSSDKDLIFYGKKYGCKLYKSEEFASLLNETIQKNSKEEEKDSDLVLSKDEVNYWYDLFKGKKNAG
jgi:predicted RNA-binding protein with PIN domain